MDRFDTPNDTKFFRRDSVDPVKQQLNKEAWVNIGNKLHENAANNEVLFNAYTGDKDSAKLAEATQIANNGEKPSFISNISNKVKDYFSDGNKEAREDLGSKIGSVGEGLQGLGSTLNRGSTYRPTVNPAQITQNQMMQKNTVSDANCKISYRVGDHKRSQ